MQSLAKTIWPVSVLQASPAQKPQRANFDRCLLLQICSITAYRQCSDWFLFQVIASMLSHGYNIGKDSPTLLRQAAPFFKTSCWAFRTNTAFPVTIFTVAARRKEKRLPCENMTSFVKSLSCSNEWLRSCWRVATLCLPSMQDVCCVIAIMPKKPKRISAQEAVVMLTRLNEDY